MDLLTWLRSLPLPDLNPPASLDRHDIPPVVLTRVAQLLLETDDINTPQEAADLLAYEFAPLPVPAWDERNPRRARDLLQAMQRIHQAGLGAPSPVPKDWPAICAKIAAVLPLAPPQLGQLLASPADSFADGVLLCQLLCALEKRIGMPPRPTVSHRLQPPSVAPLLLLAGIHPAPRSRASRLNNVQLCLRALREWKRLCPEFLWSGPALAEGDAAVAAGLARDMFAYVEKLGHAIVPAKAPRGGGLGEDVGKAAAAPMEDGGADAEEQRDLVVAPPPPPPPPMAGLAPAALAATIATERSPPRRRSRPASPDRQDENNALNACWRLNPPPASPKPTPDASAPAATRHLKPVAHVPALLLRASPPRFAPGDGPEVQRFLANPQLDAAKLDAARLWLRRLGFNILRIDGLAAEASGRDFAGYEGGPFLQDPTRNGALLCELVGLLDPSQAAAQRRLAGEQVGGFPQAEARVHAGLAGLRRLAGAGGERAEAPGLLRDPRAVLKGEGGVWAIVFALSLAFPLAGGGEAGKAAGGEAGSPCSGGGGAGFDAELGRAKQRAARRGVEWDWARVWTGELALDLAGRGLGKAVRGRLEHPRTRRTAMGNWRKALDAAEVGVVRGVRAEDVARRCRDGDWRLVFEVVAVLAPGMFDGVRGVAEAPCLGGGAELIRRQERVASAPRLLERRESIPLALAQSPRRPKLELVPRVLQMDQPHAAAVRPRPRMLLL